jgi:hypothetical protein
MSSTSADVRLGVTILGRRAATTMEYVDDGNPPHLSPAMRATS